MSPAPGPILIVEDIPHLRDALEATLIYKGYRVVTATNGEEALTRIAEERPSLILTDILMPRLDGYALAHSLRRDPSTRDIPLVFMSGTYVTEEDRAFALSLGASKFLDKPVEAEELLLTVAEALTGAMRSSAEPMSPERFYQGYRERLAAKLAHKESQVERAIKLVESVPPDQRPAFEALLTQTRAQRDDIAAELNKLAERDPTQTPSNP